MKNPYEVLGLTPSAPQDEIKTAYRNLAKELHPDMNPGDAIVEQRFKEVTAAYEMLSDEGKRGQFDRGEINADGSQRMDGMFRGGFNSAGGPGDAGFEDLVADLFGRRRRPRHTKGQSITYSVRVPFLEAARGGVQRVRLHDTTTVEVNIPAGTSDGDSLRLKGRGMPGSGGGPSGDAFVEVQVESHPYFTRDDHDIRIDVPITLMEAVLGAKVNVPTIHGTVAVTVPIGSSSGQILRLKGRGIARDGKKGDEFARLMIQLPEKIDPKLTEFVRSWTKQGDFDPRKKAGFE
ncbi:MAG: molecular chaperone DnaJ [Rhodospirillaceae bacterium]|jgi:DnaJ-class molecular chaperone|nr:molecular chaperone DnaJ [Rhodospirillaceae bacterium]